MDAKTARQITNKATQTQTKELDELTQTLFKEIEAKAKQGKWNASAIVPGKSHERYTLAQECSAYMSTLGYNTRFQAVSGIIIVGWKY